ncbi:hypothetical protein QJS04_geneDACA022856 [Acorus gramineus]|uniref:Uncharacterized protein n=1 Tax=Acorus gramineus TaxID=55184 RepID=A0AAV9AVF5_ACOGR|nr:hypothetical protein QJS04_geneDACA022856 [Acorus gramineus]
MNVYTLSPSLQKKMKEMVFEGGGLEEWVMVFLGPLRVGSQLRSANNIKIVLYD